MSTPAKKTQLRVGRLTKAHGLKGAIKVELYTDSPEQRFVPGAVFTLQVPESSPWFEKTITLTELRWYNRHPVAFFEGVSDRTAAETLIKAILWVDHQDGDIPDEPEAWFDHQLTGLTVLRDGIPIGTIARVDHFPGQDLLVVKTETNEVMVPFVKEIVPHVDVEAGTMTMTPPGGLFEDVPEDEDDATTESSNEV